jgi:hypothetical protein
VERTESAQGRDGEKTLFRYAVRQPDLRYYRGADRNSSRFIEDQGIDAGGALEKSALLIRMRSRVATLIAATIAAGPATTNAVSAATTNIAIARERSLW